MSQDFESFMREIEKTSASRKPRKRLEKEEQADILKRLRSVDGLWCFKVAVGAYGTGGVPDIIGCYRGIFFGVEMKRKGERARQLQERKHNQIRAAGGYVCVCDSAEQADAIVSEIARHLDSIRDQ